MRVCILTGIIQFIRNLGRFHIRLVCVCVYIRNERAGIPTKK